MLLWAFYKLFLEKENIHFIKRFYLLFSIIFAFTIPLITLTYQVEVITEQEVVSEMVTPLLTESNIVVAEESINYTSIILWSLYGIGMLIFGIRFIRNIGSISKKIRTNERLKEQSHINVLLSNSIVPHTFLSYIFVPKKEFRDKKIPEEVLLHEKTHVLQKHTLDILFVEALQVIFWFNPVFIFIKKSIKLNHEFLADQNVLKQQFSIQKYFELLLNYPNSSNQAVLSSPINYSLTKKRLQMMTKEFSKKRMVIKLVTLVPVLSLCILFFNNEIVAKEVVRSIDEITYPDIVNSDPETEPAITVLKDEKNEKNASLKTFENSFQEGVTEEMVKEYNIWAKDLNSKIKGNKPINIKQSDIYRMINIYKNMTSDQRKGAEQFPDIPPPPPVPESPKVMKGEKSNIPPPPPPPAPEVKKGEKSDIPPPPPPKEKEYKNNKSTKSENVKTEDGYAEILLSEDEDWTEEEKSVLKAQVQRELARERAELAREKAEIRREEAMLRAEESRMGQEIAMLSQEEARQVAENARVIAMEATQESRLKEVKARKKAEIQARKAEKEMRMAEMEARKNAQKAELEARKAMRKAEMNARKAEMEAEKKMRRAEMNAMRAEQRAARMAENNTPNKLIERMAKNDADFYYNGKQISAKEALKLVEDSNNKLSIDASTKNGKSKVKLKD
ncbi:Signal transducer regulating beta-lactamase production, contains metallopeptidase domain [Aquimarina amphilecti]|uniref:Signal transducer regulating beta-lactamase production, contains metallopeptidase domain n=2 Tax=Aquimarina amphilecti TaxID=1038014 RepID=A0A1H7RK12_AQUAM|nr:Signal transducer regulating beta-lactamase production, contains metallopeptidase domain [Aquimarina amphilecti]